MKFIKSTVFLKIFIILLVFLLDRISKIYVINLFEETQFNEIYLFEFINIYFVWNEGIAFSLLNFDNDILYNLITCLIIIISLIILYFAFKETDYSGYYFQ